MITGARTFLILFAGFLLASCERQATSPVVPTQEGAEGVEADAVKGRGENTANWWDKLPRSEWSGFERVMPDHPWFEIYRIFPDTFAIYEPGQFEEVISYLIVGENRALLFDTGLGIARLTPVVADITDLDVTVLNSHTHYDHIGGNYEFSRIAGVDHPFAMERRSGAPNDIAREFLQGDWVWKPLPDGVSVDTFEIKPFDVSEFVADGDVIDLGGITFEVIATPGHSPDSICLFDRENRRLFMGDTFYLAPLYAHIEGSNFDAYKASVDRLALLEPDLDHLVTGHNVPIADSFYLNRLKIAFDAIENGEAQFVETEGAYEYAFDGFSVIAPPPTAP